VHFIKRQNVVLALPAQCTGLSIHQFLALLAIHLVVKSFYRLLLYPGRFLLFKIVDVHDN
jgi:hypothetical protein